MTDLRTLIAHYQELRIGRSEAAESLFAALLDVAEAAARIQREAAASGWGDAAGWDMAELNAPMQSNDKALDRLREAMEADRG